MIQIIPAVDIIGGKCVRLSKGEYDSCKVYDCSPVEMVRRYAGIGIKRVHLVDLDGAKASGPVNLRTLGEIAELGLVEIEWGGGLKDDAALTAAFSAGADYAIIGSTAVRHPESFERWLSQFGAGKMILGADVRGTSVALQGWTEESSETIDSLIDRFLPSGLSQVICTDIAKDGMLQGPSDSLYVRLQRKYPSVDITVSGGISTLSDIVRLDSLGLRKVIVGKAIYENRITFEELKEYAC